MTRIEKIKAARDAAPGHCISGRNLPFVYLYGKNPYADMQIENAIFCDMFPEEVPDPNNFCGFCRADYSLSRQE